MKMKLFCAVAALGLAGASQAALADAPAPTPEFTIDGTAAVVSQYRFRGISQSNNNPAFQGSILVTDKSGFYLSSWGSSTADVTDYYNGSPTPVGPGGTEIDVFGGWSHTYAKSGVTVDGGLYGYLYPNAPINNYYEVYGDLSKSFGPVGAKIGLNWAPSQHLFTAIDAATHYSIYEYFELTYSPPKLSALTLHSHIGHTGGGEDYFTGQYLDYTVGVGYKWKALTFDVSLVGTNITTAKVDNYINQFFDYSSEATPAITEYQFDENYYKRPAKTVAVVSVTASF